MDLDAVLQRLAKTVNEATILNNFQFTIIEVAFERF